MPTLTTPPVYLHGSRDSVLSSRYSLAYYTNDADAPPTPSLTPRTPNRPNPSKSILPPPPKYMGHSVRTQPSLTSLRTQNSLPSFRSDTPLVERSKSSFWLVFSSLCVSTFLSALDTTSFSTALPTIVDDLQGSQFIWVGIAYTMASTATLPVTGGVAQAFGRKPVLLGALVLFLAGSVVCAAAKNMTTMIIGRAVQGIGGGAISSLSEIIISDLVPLNKRGMYTGIVSAVWAFASGVGPPVGGAFSQTSWRWLFYMNVPLTLIAFACVFCFLNLKQPKGNFMSKLRQMDWLGNFIIIASSSIFVFALSNPPILPWGIPPIVVGSVGYLVFFWYEAKIASNPTIPWDLVSNRTSVSGYLITFFHAISSSAVVFYMPVYFQSAKMKSPTQAGVAVFGSVFSVTPAAIICGFSVVALNKYRFQNYVGWLICIAGFALLSTLTPDTPAPKWVGYQIITGIGLGILYSSPKFPILAALPIEKSANALAFFSFVRKFSGIWGITMGSTILEALLPKYLPPVFLQYVGGNTGNGADIAYASIPKIADLPEPLRQETREAFAKALRVLWLALVAVCGAGLFSCLLMKEVPMHEDVDEKWGMDDGRDEEHEDPPLVTVGLMDDEKASIYDDESQVLTIHEPLYSKRLSTSTAHVAITPLSSRFRQKQEDNTAQDLFREHALRPWSPRRSFHLLDPPPKLHRGSSHRGRSSSPYGAVPLVSQEDSDSESFYNVSMGPVTYDVTLPPRARSPFPNEHFFPFSARTGSGSPSPASPHTFPPSPYVPPAPNHTRHLSHLRASNSHWRNDSYSSQWARLPDDPPLPSAPLAPPRRPRQSRQFDFEIYGEAPRWI